jgi:hypothetical protein
MATLNNLHSLGQSTWLNYLRSSFIRSGELAEHVKHGIQGVTANAQVYERAILGSSDYDAGLRRAMAEGKPARRIHEALLVDDVQRAAASPRFQGPPTDGCQLQLEPAYSGVATAVECATCPPHRPLQRHGRDSGHGRRHRRRARAVADGVSVNVTPILSSDYEDRRRLAGWAVRHQPQRLAHRATAANFRWPARRRHARLEALGRPDLLRQAAVALARRPYAGWLFSGPTWDKLAARRGQPLRPRGRAPPRTSASTIQRPSARAR